MRVRRRGARLALVAALAVAAGSSLTACRSEPATAVYLSDRRISVEQVAAIVRDVNAVAERRLAARRLAHDERAAAIRAGRPPEEYPPLPAEAQLPVVHTTVTEVLSLFVCADVGHRLVAERGLATSPTTATQFAGAFGLPESSPYVLLWADYWTSVNAVGAVEQARPLEQDEAERLFDALDAAGRVQEGTDYDGAIGALRQNVKLGPVFQAQLRFAEGIDAAGLSINPRYGDLVMPVVLAPDGVQVDVAFPHDSDVPVEEA